MKNWFLHLPPVYVIVLISNRKNSRLNQDSNLGLQIYTLLRCHLCQPDESLAQGFVCVAQVTARKAGDTDSNPGSCETFFFL